jgi:hypothetical protein
MANFKTIVTGRWTTSAIRGPRRIQVTSFRGGWVVGEATVDNAQFFHDRVNAEAAACSFGERLGSAGEPSQISIRLADGASGGRFIVSGPFSSEVHSP